MRIDDIYEYDLETPIYINDGVSTSNIKDGLIKKGDKLPLGNVLAYAIRELNPSYVLSLVQKNSKYKDLTITLKNKNSYIVFDKIREMSHVFIELALKLDNDEKNRLQVLLLKDFFSKINLSSLDSDTNDLYKSIRSPTIVKRWEPFNKILYSTGGLHSNLNDKIFCRLIGILYDKSEGKIFNVLSHFLDKQDDIKNIRGIKIELEYFEAFNAVLKEVKPSLKYFEKKEKKLFENLKLFFYEKCLSDNSNIFNYQDIFSHDSNLFFNKLLTIADNKYYEDIYRQLCKKSFLNDISMSIVHDFIKRNTPNSLSINEKIEVNKNISTYIVDNKVIIDINIIDLYGVIVKNSSSSDLSVIAINILKYKDMDLYIEKEKNNLKNVGKYEDPEVIEDKIKNAISLKKNFFSKITDMLEPLYNVIKTEGYKFVVSLKENNGNYALVFITEAFLEEAVVNSFVKMIETPNMNFKNEEHFGNINSLLLKEILKSDLKSENKIVNKTVKLIKF